MDKMREEFEAWYSDFYGYGEAHKKELWDTWKASRAALCVELPTKINDDNDAHSYGYDSAITDVEMALELSGVSYI